ncbi:YigZ family protein [Helicobacter pylori]|uniref:YigZ family protein n=1 Tax=Helicobacter pylori TaxID=210 RepID=UPI00112D2CEC|nr:YigZ family protein [Helicobacter pylori]TPH52996.1 YigZ family protein [Helicobacter pylori]TPH99056.1 YigZ family protein [Helicobacter pylori]TPI05643.1 YigZ family protein [Helicobacter pylori]UOS00304.1 YigZ family protein [Helicobacter pylori]UOS10215.1 YigZ family protein [Helicobacter pylori]
MKTLKNLIISKHQTKASRFLGYLMPFDDFEKTLLQLKKEHFKAAHFVTAFRYCLEGKITEGFSDDGEPKGSSGMPMLSVLRREDLINIGLVSVRYFGGTLLGVGGLMKAYATSALLCVENAKRENAFKDFVELETLSAHYSYKELDALQREIKKFSLQLSKKNFSNQSVEVEISGARENLQAFLQQNKMN